MRDLRAPAGTRGARYALAAVAVALFGLLSIQRPVSRIPPNRSSRVIQWE